MDEEKTRQKAIELFQAGGKISEICNQLNKSRKWFYKWKRRFISKPLEEWYKDESKVPKHFPRKRSFQLEQKILSVRKKLQAEKYAQIGAISIQYEFFNQGEAIPAVWTINRVLKAHGLVKKKSLAYKSKNLPYPGNKYISVHQMDFVGPRYIKGFGRIYSLNIIDTETHFVHINAISGKSVKYVIPSVVRFWKQYGFPDYLQMDNELSFRGSNKYPRSFGKLIRFALSQGVIVIFIPVSEPWRNGIIEKFNDKFDKYFYRKNVFADLEDMKKKLWNLRITIIRTTGIQPTKAKHHLSNVSFLGRILDWNNNILYQIKSHWKKEKLLLFAS